MAKKPDFEVFVSEKNGDKNYFTKVGAAWRVASDGISIKLKPNLSVSNDLVLFPPQEQES